MKIAIIGAGNVGTALGRTFVRTGHSVVYASQGAETSRKAAEAVGGTAARNVREAAQGADIVVLAVPYASAARQVALEIAPAVTGKIVVDATNPIGADGGLATKDISGAEEFARWMPGARMVKAFNTVFAAVQADPRAHGLELDIFIATDDDQARATIAELVKSSGFRPVYVGPLARARELEAMALLNIQLQMAAGGDWRTSYIMVGAPAAALEHPAPTGAATRKG